MIAILGAGITALAAALRLQQRGIDFIILEKSDRCGGKIQTVQKDGYTMEMGPNTVLINNKEIKDFLEQLNLLSETIQPDSEAVKRRLVLKNNSIEEIPTSFKSAWQSKLFNFRTFRSVVAEIFKKPSPKSASESLADFSRRRFGKQIYEDFVTPFVSGIYAGDPEKMSINYTLAILKEAEEKYGSVLKGMPKIMKQKKLDQADWQLPKQKIFSFHNGLSEMVEAVTKKLGKKIEYNIDIQRISKSSDGYTIQYKKNGKATDLAVDKVISTLPAFALSETIDFDPALSNQLKQIKYVPAVVTHIGIDKKNWLLPKKAFGLLSRKAEEVPFLGILFNSNFFPHQSKTDKMLLTVISGGYKNLEMIEKDDETIVEEISLSLKKLGLIKGDKGDIEMSHVYRWNRGIPQYEIGYEKVEAEIDRFLEENPSFFIGGNYFKGISVSDCISNGYKLADQIN